VKLMAAAIVLLVPLFAPPKLEGSGVRTGVSFRGAKQPSPTQRRARKKLELPNALTRAERECALRNPGDPLWVKRAPDVYRVRIETTKGNFVLEVKRSLAPRAADRFYHLVQTGFYDNSRFYRVITGRFVQFGIAGDPAIAQVWQNARFPDDSVRASNVRGTLAFAMTGPNARTTQIYINTGDQSRLDGIGFAPFGKVVEGMDVIDRLYSGYGERSGGGMRAGHQGKLFQEGNAYLDREFPRLDRLLRAAIVSRR
jgi:cyclophilin family peptidyl-prolyl cis-trans isomerase